MLKPAWPRMLRDPMVWLLLVGLILAAALLALLIVLAVERHDTFLRLRPLICEQGISDHRFFVVAVTAPLWLLFSLATFGELWGQIERRRSGQPSRWFHVGLFLLLASAFGALVLYGLGC